MPKLTFNQEEILARVEVLDRKQGELEKRLREAEVALGEQQSLATSVQAALDKLRSDVATALEREQRIHERIERVAKRVDGVLGVAQGTVR